MTDADASPRKVDICPVCSLPIRPGESVRFKDGKVIHVVCSVKQKGSTATGTH